MGLAPAWAGPTLDKIKQAGTSSAASIPGSPGSASRTARARYSGFDIDICKAIAAAVLGDPEKVKYVPLTAQQRFTALQSGEIDILSRNTTVTLQRDAELGLNFAPVVFYDGQGFMVPKKLGVKSAKELNGATICVQPGTTTELNLADYFRANNMQFKPLVIEKLDEVVSAYLSGRCDVITTDRSGLAGIRTGRDAEPRRPRHPARDDLEGAARAGGAPGRRSMGRHRALGRLRADRGRGEGHHAAESR